MPAQYDSPNVGNRHGQLDGLQALRFFAALLVVAMHSTMAVTGPGGGYFQQGSYGVDIFFVISGFVMALTAPRTTPDWAGRCRAARNFMQRRISRVVPLYWLYSLAKVVAVLAVPAYALRTTLDFQHVAASFLFLPMRSPWNQMEPVLPVGWTLCFEMFFYAVFTLSIFLGAPRIIFCTVSFLAISLAAPYWPGSDIMQFFSRDIVFEFVVGMLLARLWTLQLKIPAWAGLLALLPSLAVMAGILHFPNTSRLLTWGIAAALLVWGITVLERQLRKLRFMPFCIVMGDASYSLYLSHSFAVPLVVALTHRVLPASAVASLAIGVSIAVGYASYRFIEQPLIRYQKKRRGSMVAGRPAPE